MPYAALRASPLATFCRAAGAGRGRWMVQVLSKRICWLALEALRLIHYHDLILKNHAAQIHTWQGRRLVPIYHPSPQVLASHRREQQQLNDYRVVAEALKSIPK